MISVIVPVYKVAKYLRQCLDSVLSQTMENWQCLVVDDGSPDGCSEMLDDASLKDTRFCTVHKANGGLSDARNVGLDLQRNDYTFFLDSDDYIESKALERLYELQISSDFDICIGGYCTFKDGGGKKTIVKNCEVVKYDMTSALNYLFGREGIWFTTAWGKIYRRKLFNKVRYPIGKIYEDGLTTYKLFLQSQTIISTRQELYNYRLRRDGIMQSYPSTVEMQCAPWLEPINYCKKNNLNSMLPVIGSYCLEHLCEFYYNKRKNIRKSEKVKKAIDSIRNEVKLSMDYKKYPATLRYFSPMKYYWHRFFTRVHNII